MDSRIDWIALLNDIDADLQPATGDAGKADAGTSSSPFMADDLSMKRKRGQSTADLVKEAQSSLLQALEEYERLSLGNLKLKAKARILELLIHVKDQQVERVGDVDRGACCFWDKSFINITPSEALKRSNAYCLQFPARLEGFKPLLGKYPELLLPKEDFDSLQGWRLGLQGTQSVLAEFKPANDAEAAQLQKLQTTVTEIAGRALAQQYAIIANSRMLLKAARNTHAYPYITSWDQLTTGSFGEEQWQACGDVAKTGPLIATEEFWQQVVEKLHLTDQQLLYIEILASVIDAACQSNATRRASYSRALAVCDEEQQSMDGFRRQASTESRESSPGIAALNRSPQELQREATLMARIQRTLDKDRCLIVLAREVFLKYLLSPVQCALAFMYSSPYVLDELALLHAAASRCTSEVEARLVGIKEKASGNP